MKEPRASMPSSPELLP